MRTVPSSVACRRAGITYRQFDYWLRTGGIPEDRVERAFTGSGYNRRVDESLIPALRAVRSVSESFATAPRGHGISTLLVRRIIDNYDAGRIEFRNGVTITWPVLARSAA